MDELLARANRLYRLLPVHGQHAVDEDSGSGLEQEELPDGYTRLRNLRGNPLGDGHDV